MSAETGIVTVACVRCLTANQIVMGVSFWEADEFYQCGNCHLIMRVNVTQHVADAISHNSVQVGKVV